jgi:hypothetical protein
MINKDKAKKIIRTIRRKWLKPFAYASLMSLMIYIIIGDVIVRKYSFSSTSPHFVISRVEDKFEQTEYMHMLLTIQEVNKTILREDLKRFISAPLKANCPKYLKLQLYKMNWDHTAFQIRAKRLIDMYEIYDQVARLEETIKMLDEESKTSTISSTLFQQVLSLQQERDRIVDSSLTKEEYEFIKEYGGVVPSLQIIDEK